jgi:glycosyltransferase involved in cell wall biosynthesis
VRIGAILRCDNTGLGIQSKEFFDHIPCNPFVIDSSLLGKSTVLTPHADRYGVKPYQLRKNESIPEREIQNFIRGIDLLFAIETPYNYRFFSACREKGIKTVLQLNYEFLEYPSALPQPDLLAAPSMWNFENIPDRKMFLPVPVNTAKFNPTRVERTFIHIAGRPAIHDRNGTQVLLNALRYVRNQMTVIIRTPEPLKSLFIPRNVNLVIDTNNRLNYQDAYTGGVLVMPRKYGGLCLPINEALGAEMPVIVSDISPNNLWLPKEWLTPARKSITLKARKTVDVYEPDVRTLAGKMDQFCDPDFYDSARAKAKELKDSISWENLLPLYNKTFQDLCS